MADKRTIESKHLAALTLPCGSLCKLKRRMLPGLRRYYVLTLPSGAEDPDKVAELQAVAHRVGRLLATHHHGDPECFSAMYNGARTRRRPWPHVHILIARSVADKRRCLFFFQLKHVLRWRRWPVIRGLLETA